MNNQGRRHPLIQVATNDVTRIFATALGRRQIDRVIPLAGGFSTTVFHVTSGSDSFVLRVYLQESTATKEANLAALVRGRVETPELVYADVQGRQCGHPLAIFRFVEGVVLDQILRQGDARDISGAAWAVGTALADISAITLPTPGFFDEELVPVAPSHPLAHEVLEYVRRQLFETSAAAALGEDVRDRYWELVQEVVTQIQEVETDRSLVHADFNGKNILLRSRNERWEVSAILDWEFAFSGTSLFDIGNMLRFEHEMHPAFRPAFLSGFTGDGGALPENWEAIARTVDVVNLCEFLTNDQGRFFEQARQLVIRAVRRGSLVAGPEGD